MEEVVFFASKGYRGFLKKDFSFSPLEVIAEGLEIGGGRGRVLLKDGVVARSYRRGGLPGRFLKNLFFPEYRRCIREFFVTDYALKRGISVPEPLGVVWRRRGIFIEAWFFSRFLEGESLLERGVGPDELRLLGKVVGELHRAGIIHRDLNVRNFLLVGEKLFVLDFDRAVVKGRLRRSDRKRGLMRLLRSLCKEGLYRDGFERFLLEGYGEPLDISTRWLWRLAWKLGI